MQQRREDPGVRLRVADLSTAAPTGVDIAPDADWRAALAVDLCSLGVRKLRFAGQIAPAGSADWQLTGTLGATVVQACVVTLDPVSTRLDEAVARTYLAQMPELPEAAEVEMPEDDSVERLGDDIDLFGVLREALSLSLPTYPRADGASAEVTEARPAGAAPITSIGDDAFSALSDLKKKLEKDGK